MKKFFIIPVLIVSVASSYIPLYASGKNEKQRESREILRNIQEKDSYKIQTLSLQDQGKGKFSHKQKAYNIDIGFDTDTKKVILRKGKLEMTMGIPQKSPFTTIKMLDGQLISSDEKSDIVTQSIDGGVRQMINIYSSDAEKIYDFSLTLPDGYTLTQDGSGNIVVKNLSGNILSYIGRPWAKDANGNEIPTHYEIQGNTLRQFIDFDGKTAFPIVADPAWCGASIASTNWINRGGTHPWSLSITPTACGRLTIGGAGGLNVNYSWEELLVLTPSSIHWNKAIGTQVFESMYYQYACHANFVPFKSNWNLEPTRPNVGYTATISAGCNPN